MHQYFTSKSHPVYIYLVYPGPLRMPLPTKDYSIFRRPGIPVPKPSFVTGILDGGSRPQSILIDFLVPWFRKKVPSRKLTYPPKISKNGILKMIFLFPRWDMLIPWRVNRKQVIYHGRIGKTDHMRRIQDDWSHATCLAERSTCHLEPVDNVVIILPTQTMHP